MVTVSLVVSICTALAVFLAWRQGTKSLAQVKQDLADAVASYENLLEQVAQRQSEALHAVINAQSETNKAYKANIENLMTTQRHVCDLLQFKANSAVPVLENNSQDV